MKRSRELWPSFFVLLRGVKIEKVSLVRLSEINQLFSVLQLIRGIVVFWGSKTRDDCNRVLISLVLSQVGKETKEVNNSKVYLESVHLSRYASLPSHYRVSLYCWCHSIRTFNQEFVTSSFPIMLLLPPPRSYICRVVASGRGSVFVRGFV